MMIVHLLMFIALLTIMLLKNLQVVRVLQDRNRLPWNQSHPLKKPVIYGARIEAVIPIKL